MMEHTAVPWFTVIAGRKDHRYIEVVHRDCVIATLRQIYNPNFDADAHLVKAAPDLLRACQNLVDAMERYQMGSEGEAPISHRNMMRDAYAAIDRANGK
jgi:hypothetical protein